MFSLAKYDFQYKKALEFACYQSRIVRKTVCTTRILGLTM